MILTADDLRGMIGAIGAAIIENRDQLNQLDATLGDGDHGTGIAAGFEATLEAIQQAIQPDEVLRITATTLMNRMGGSSGALYGTLFLKASLQVKGQGSLSPDTFADMWLAGNDGVMQRGKAQPGDKTMIDALSPAVDALKQAVDEGKSFIDALAKAAEAAERGTQATTQMQAKHGRARYVGERAIGHADAGAMSVSLMFRAMHEYWRKNHNGQT